MDGDPPKVVADDFTRHISPEILINAQKKDYYFSALRENRTQDLIFYKDLIYKKIGSRVVPFIPGSIKNKVLEIFYVSPDMGHMGIEKTYKRLSKVCYWEKLKDSVTNYVRSCDSCQKYK